MVSLLVPTVGICFWLKVLAGLISNQGAGHDAVPSIAGNHFTVSRVYIVYVPLWHLWQDEHVKHCDEAVSASTRHGMH